MFKNFCIQDTFQFCHDSSCFSSECTQHLKFTGCRRQKSQCHRRKSDKKTQVGGKRSGKDLELPYEGIAPNGKGVSGKITLISFRYPLGTIPPRDVFMRHQCVLIAISFLEWSGVRRELVTMLSTCMLLPFMISRLKST